MNLPKSRTIVFILTFVVFNLKVDSLRCQSDALRNFDFLWELFNENYASFEEKEIDWNEIRDTYRSQINDSTTDVELYAIFEKMLKPLNDGHVTLRAKNLDSAFSASRPSRIIKAFGEIPRSERRPLFKVMVSKTLQQKGFKPIVQKGPEFRNEKLFSYANNGTYGYISFLRSFYSTSRAAGKPLEKLLDEIFQSFYGLEGIIIDIRFNIGGDDKFSQTLAGHFVDKKQVGFYKQTRKNSEYGAIKSKYIEPKGVKPYSKKVVLITNDRSVSAADVFALMMAQLPNVVVVGEPTNGSYSDLYGKTLPNGWKVTLSNQRYFDLEKKNYEGRGTPVDVLVLNTKEDLDTQEDPVLVKAFEILDRGADK